MPEIIVDGIQIDFPFEPYPCQLEYMSKVIEALKDGKHAILESPTGTGKTLCLLCATLAWQGHTQQQIRTTADEIVTHSKKSNSQTNITRPNLVPKIIYSSRTHSQLSQCINAMKKSPYSNRKIGMIASREQLCINSKVMNLESNSAKIYGCKSRVKRRACHFYNKFEETRESLKSETKIGDIEDLMTIGKQKTICPYFLSREMLDDADITFMPYNYLLDSRIRRLYNIDLSNNIIIFDEAHNIEQVCEDNASAELTSMNLLTCLEELKALGDYLLEFGSKEDLLTEVPLNEMRSDKIPDVNEVLSLKDHLFKLEINFHAINTGKEKLGLTKSVDILFDLLKSSDIHHSNKSKLLELIDLVSSFIGMSREPKLRAIGMKGLEKVGSFLKIVFHDDIENADLENLQTRLANYYRVYVQDTEMPTSSGKSNKTREAVMKNRVLSYWCLSPGRTMKELANCGVRSIILTSGTLYPIETVKMDMEINIEVELRNRHVINPDQLLVSVCPQGPDGETLNSSYETREKLAYTTSLGLVLVNLLRIIPRGLLVVFPSYGMMKKCIERWESCDVYNSMMRHKQVIIEPQNKVKFSAAMSQFHNKNIDHSGIKGAVLLAVARGKVSEGIDLSDHQGRGVIIIGLPYPAMMEPRIQVKMSFLDERMNSVKHGISGRVWYKQQAYRAVNQSIGRVIRHSRDFGAVYLCDERFASADSRSQLPQWLQPSIRICNTFGEAMSNSVDFFKSVVVKYPPPSLGIDKRHSQIVRICSSQLDKIKTPRISTNSILDRKKDMLFSAKVLNFSASLKRNSVKTMQQLNETQLTNNTQNSFKKPTLSISMLKNTDKLIKPGVLTPSVAENIDAICMPCPEYIPPKKVKRFQKIEVSEPEETIESSEYFKIIKSLFSQDFVGFQNYKKALKSFQENNNVVFLSQHSSLRQRSPGSRKRLLQIHQ